MNEEQALESYAMNVPNLRRRSQAVYLACEEPVAKDISAALLWAADEIERLGAEKLELANHIDGCVRVAADALKRAEAERERCASIALAIDSGRGNEKEIARAIRALVGQAAPRGSCDVAGKPTD